MITNNQNIKVIGWTSWNDTRSENVLDGSNLCVHGHSFEEYLNNLDEKAKPYAIALRDEIIYLKLKITGIDHQRMNGSVPLFSDNTISKFSFRGWGGMMAAIWNSAENVSTYTYMDFYI